MEQVHVLIADDYRLMVVIAMVEVAEAASWLHLTVTKTETTLGIMLEMLLLAALYSRGSPANNSDWLAALSVQELQSSQLQTH